MFFVQPLRLSEEDMLVVDMIMVNYDNRLRVLSNIKIYVQYIILVELR